MAAYIYHIFVALDQLANAVLLGHADETLSARAWRVEQDGKWFGKIARPVIDILALVLTLGWDKHHCKESFESERLRRHLPPIYLD